VELAAKPSLLLFLDEPTSGLDSQSAYSIVRFLKKLARAGQAIICTIHQPSSVLIQQFDMILALNPGGNTFYFGPVGDNGSEVIKYFTARGVECPPEKNVAEFILETAAKGGKRKDGKKLDWNKEWRESEQAKNVKEEIKRIRHERSKVQPPPANEQHEFASPVALQTVELTNRLFIQYWRDPAYLYGKLFVSVIIVVFNDFTFWQLGYTVADMQDRVFTSFLILLIPPTIVNAVVPKFYQNRPLWEARELPSRIYGWVAFCTANVVAEIPIAIVGATIYWALWYWPTGLPTDSSTSGYVYLMTMLFVSSPTSILSPHLTSLVPFPSQLGTMDLCFRTLIHSHLQRPPVLLRHVLALQRRRPTIQPAICLLEILDVLAKPIHVLDWRSLGRNTQQHSSPMCLY
jgi:ATP-binding cassette subfamily G (WHITE) protein 2 (SNQ2)